MRKGGTAIWQGFDFRWANTPHRLHYLGSWLDEIEVRDSQVHGACHSSLTVGRVPDKGVARTLMTPVFSQKLRFREGVQALTLSTELGVAAEVRGEEVVVPVLPNETGTALLQGFHIRCESHPMGLHPQGIGVRLSDMRIEAGALRFVPVFFFHPTNSPDVVTSGSGRAHFICDVRYTAVISEQTHVHITVPNEQLPCVVHCHRRGELGTASTTLKGRAASSLNRGVVGVRGFRWEQQHRSFFGRNGRFMRRFQVSVGAHTYCPDRGESLLNPELHFCNKGLVPYPIRAQHQLWTTLIQYESAQARPAMHAEEHAMTSGVGEGGRGRSRFAI